MKTPNKKSENIKKSDRKLDASEMKKVKGGQTPLHRSTQIKGKGQIS